MTLGVDTGGTFTDLVAIAEDGSLTVRKTPSIPADPSESILNAIQLASPAAGFRLVHGTTVATNALLERRGARTALLTTLGCRDVLEIGRQTRGELYSLNPSPREPLIPRELRFEVPERLDWQGEVITALDSAAVERALDAIVEAGAESLAVCFLFSFLRPAHEEEVGRLARERGLFVSLSSRIAPEFREYERTATVCANSFVGPVMERYIGRLCDRLDNAGMSRLSIMQSNGGTLRAREAAEVAVKTVLSGPAGGLIAASRVARSAGYDRIIAFDMGGTSTDVALSDNEPRTVRTGEVAGLPLLTPMLDIHTVGAGGGSIARLDRGGALRVGPHSAGADPGPVAYGRGEELTVTDANVLLGRLPADVRLAGSVALDVDRVRARFADLARHLKVAPEVAAEGIVAVVNANMARALRHISTERGHDPADYTLVSFGGAGGLHACELAEMLRIPRVLVPRYPGAFSALGLAMAEPRREAARSLFAENDDAGERKVRTALRELSQQIMDELRAEGHGTGDIDARPFVELRYVGQSYALRVDCGARTSLASTARRFHRAHHDRYGYSDSQSAVEAVAVGVMGTARRQDSPLPAIGMPAAPGSGFASSTVYFLGARIETPLYRRGDLALGQQVDGPAIVLQEDATTFVPPEWKSNADSGGNLLLTPA